MARGIESILTDRRVLDWGDSIQKLEPDAYPLTVLTKKFGKEKAGNQVFVSFEDRPWVRFGVVDDVTAKTGSAPDEKQTFTLRETAGAGSAPYLAGYIKVGDILWDYTQDCMLYVDSVNYSTGVITVIVNYSGLGIENMASPTQSGKTFDISDTTPDTSVTVADGDKILKLDNAWEDGGNAAPPRAQNLVKVFNFVQKMKDSYSVDEETMLAELNGEPELKRLQARMAIEHAKNIEYRILFGKKNARISNGEGDTTAGKYIYTTGGLYYSGMGADNITEPLTETAFRAFLRKGFRYGSSRKALVIGGLIAEGIDTWALGRLQLNEKAKQLGLTMTDYLYSGKVASIVRHPLLEDDMEGIGFLLDLNVLKYKYITDTVLETGLQANDAEERLDQFKTRMGVKLGFLEYHRKIYGVTEIAG